QMATSNYYAAVRGIMRDSVENLQTLAAWHSAAGIYADPYSLTEVATALGTADVSNISSAQLSQPELDNFIAFRTLAATLRPNANNPAVNWPAATPAQVVELQRIAEANTGRSSAMAKGVLCFFFDICYEEDETKGLLVETFHGTSPQNGTDGGLLVYPNPTDGTIYVELSAADIQYITIFNLQGEVMKYISTPQGKNSFISIKDLPSGIYMIRVTGSNGHIYHHKLIKR
ncbi:MAG: T9SS type A sorting domain-containing protein, partial [Bacteroidales bacterium]|nr:T9SS type A sorting domain-containing protein [Bacteroidales bacterium]